MALTSNQKIRYEAQRQYWRKREQQQREANLLQDKQTEAEIKRIYSEMDAWATNQINAFYGKYADAEGITLAEAKKRVSKADISQYEALAKQYVKDKDFSDKANAEMKLYNATMRINRLELLKAEIGLGLVDGANRLDKLADKTLTDRALEELQRRSGILGTTITEQDTLKRAKNIANASFYNATYSDRVWAHMDSLADEIAVQLNQGLIAGISAQEMARRIRHNAIDQSQKNAERLVLTELSRVMTDVAKDNYLENGYEQYEYLAVNPNACPECLKLDGLVFFTKDMEPGLNAPPMHPRCHCSTTPYVDEAGYEAWLNYLEQGGTTAEWNSMTPAEKSPYYSIYGDRVPFSKMDIFASTPSNTSGVFVEEPNWSFDGEKLYNRLTNQGIEYKPVEKYTKQPSEDIIIKNLAGGDMTKGSCMTLAWAYAVSKGGCNVRDFRGGRSQNSFASNYERMIRLLGIDGNYLIETGGGKRPAKALLNNVNEGEQYILITGRHATVVKKENNKLYYLELQDPYNNGWTAFEREYKTYTYDGHGHFNEVTKTSTISETLDKRFSCRGRTISDSYLIGIDDVANNKEIQYLAGFFNTDEGEQLKSKSGSRK